MSLPGEAAEWHDEVFKRVYWTGYRDNYIGLTWFGDEGLPVFPVQEYLFDHDVGNALHTSPSLYNFLKDTVLGASGWNVPVSRVNLMAHSLGNLVAWDALRINQWRSPGTQIVNNILGVQSAVWEDAFWAWADIGYVAADGDDPVAYTAAGLPLHSWAFWFQQPGHEARTSANGFYHSATTHDNVVRYWQRVNEMVRRGSVVQGQEHYFRDRVNSYPEPRNQDTLHDTPTLMLHGKRHRDVGGADEYDYDHLTMGMGCVGTALRPFPASGVPLDATTGYGWGDSLANSVHSSFINVPSFAIYRWYYEFVRIRIGATP